MIVFWLVAALMLAAAVALLLWPLLIDAPESGAGDADDLNVTVFRDRLAELERARIEAPLSIDEYRQARRELECELLTDTARETPGRAEPPLGRWAAPLIGALAPVLAIALYLKFGAPQLLDPAAGQRHPSAAAPVAGDMGDVAAGLRARLRQQPEDVEGWLLLARTLVVMERYTEAVETLQEARGLTGDAPALLAEQAELIAMTRDGDMAGEPMQLIEKALAGDPSHPHALWLAGLGAAQQQRFAEAEGFWTQLLEQTPGDSDEANLIKANIERAREAMKRSTATARDPEQAQPTATSEAP